MCNGFMLFCALNVVKGMVINMNLKFSNEKDHLILSICGEIDHRYSIRIRNEADKKIVTYPNKDFIIDLSDVTFMDSVTVNSLPGVGTKIVMKKLIADKRL